MVSFLVVELIRLGLNLRFNVGVVYLWLIILSVVGGVSVDNETLFNQLCESQDQVGSVF
jgi:uncharacterized membrane protein (Fun14 family)